MNKHKIMNTKNWKLVFKVGLMAYMMFCQITVWCQYSITGFGSGNTYVQNFDGFAGNSGTVPTYWSVTSTNSYGGYYNRNGSYSNSNGIFALRESSTSTDNSIGAKVAAASGNCSGSGQMLVEFSATNNTGSNITGFTITWNVEQYSQGLRATTIDFSYKIGTGAFSQTGISGTTLTTASTGTPDANLPAIALTGRSISITGLNIAPSTTITFRFTTCTGAGSGSNAHLGTDDFTFYAQGNGCTPPTTQATAFSATNIQPNQMQANWVRGTSPGDNVLVVARQGSAVTTDPTNGTNYTANAAFGSGAQIGTGNYVVYNGTGTNVTVTALTSSTTYHYAIYEYNNTDYCYNLTQLTGNATTECSPPTSQATNFTATNIQTTQMQANWTRGNGTAGVLVVARASGPVDADPVSGTNYTANAAFGSGTQIGTGNYVVYKGTGTNIPVTSLTGSTTYHYAIYEYNTTGTCFNVTELTGNGTTACSPPTTQATSFSATNIQPNQMQVNWTSGNGTGGVLVVARQGSAVNADPISGSSYIANATFGSGDQIGTGNYVVYNGTGTDVTVTGLSLSTTYHYAIYEYNTTGTCYNVTELIGNATTTCLPPLTQASTFSASNIGTNQMQVDWVRGNGDNVLVVARQGSPVTTDPTSGFSYTANAAFGSGSQIGTGNYVVYNGNGTNVTVTSLTIGTTYHFAIYEYSDAGVCYNTAELTGNATTLSPEIQLEHPIGTNAACGFTLDFGNVNVGSSTSLTVRIRNTGTSDLNLTSLPLTIGGTHANNYSFTTQPSSPIAAGSFSDVVIQFTPSTTGTRTANTSIANNDSNENPCSISLTGVGTLANDNCAGATPLTVYGTTTCGGATSGTTVGATSSGLPALTCNAFTGNADDDVWYSFVATSTSHTITVVGASPLDAVVDVRSGACNGTNIACADATPSGGTEVVNATGLTINETYLVRVYGYGTGSGTGTFTICVTTPPPPSYFRSKTTGNWTSTSTWQYSTDNNNWNDAVATPTSSDFTITIRNGHTVTVNTNVTADEISIESGGILSHSGSTFTINNGAGNDLTIQNGGKLSLPTTSTTPTINSGALVSIQSGGILTVGNTGIIDNLQTSSYDYGNGSILEYTSNNNPATSNVTFFPNANSTTIPILRITGTLSSPGGSNPTIINGILEVATGASVSWSGTGSKTFRNGITGTGTVSQGTAGQFIISGTASSITGGTLTLGTSGMSITGTVTLESNETVNSGTISVASGGILECGNYTISGTTGFTLSSGATIRTANATGISGTIAVSGTKTFSNGASYEFQGNSTGTFTTTPIAATVNNLIVNRTGGDVSLDQDISVGGVLTLISGRLNLNGKNLTLSSAVGGIPGWGSLSAKYIIASTGTLTKSNPASFIFPIGTATEYLPCLLTGDGTFAVNLSPTTTGLANPSQALPNQWNITGSGTLDMDYQWTNNVFGTDAYLYKHNGSNWSNVGGPVAASGGGQYPYTVEFNGIACCSGFTVGGEGLLPVELVYFNANQQQTSTLLTWQTASELNNSHFAIERSTNGTAYREIGIVRGNGTSYALNDYRFVDERPAPGTNYYRLRQIDFDGNFEYSRVVTVNFGERDGEVLLYPTLANDEVMLQFSNPTVSNGTILLYTQNGRLVRTIDFEEETTEVRMDVSTLPSGNYYVRVQSGRLLETLRFVKQ